MAAIDPGGSHVCVRDGTAIHDADGGCVPRRQNTSGPVFSIRSDNHGRRGRVHNNPCHQLRKHLAVVFKRSASSQGGRMPCSWLTVKLQCPLPLPRNDEAHTTRPAFQNLRRDPSPVGQDASPSIVNLIAAVCGHYLRDHCHALLHISAQMQKHSGSYFCSLKVGGKASGSRQ